MEKLEKKEIRKIAVDTFNSMWDKIPKLSKGELKKKMRKLGYIRFSDLPSEEEIQDIIYKHCKKVKINSTEWVRIQVAKVISKRIGNAKEKKR